MSTTPTLSELAGEAALAKPPQNRTPGDRDRAQFALTGERSGTHWCDCCGDHAATRTNSSGDRVCADCT